jgi:bacillithiol system protein YtxJ
VLQQVKAGTAQQTIRIFSDASHHFFMNWKTLTTPEQVAGIKDDSFNQPQVIFKHSTRCSISSMAKSRLERNEQPENVDFHYLDLIAYRNISDKIAADFDVYHESPQILLIKNGECVYTESHMGISMDELEESLGKA